MRRSQFGVWLVKAGAGKAGGKTCATRPVQTRKPGTPKEAGTPRGADVDAEAAGELEGFAEAEGRGRRG